MLRHDGRYRSSPLFHSPLPLDPRVLGIRDVDIALQQARHGLDGHGSDYFSNENTRRGERRSSTPPYDSLSPLFVEDAARYKRETSRGSELDELVRRTNLAVSLANQGVHPKTHYAQLHPMMCSDGKFPADFRSPKTVESVKLLDNSQLDRILQGYKLPYDSRSVLDDRRMPGEPLTSSRMRQAKLLLLYEYIGAIRIVEHEKMKHVWS